MSQGTIPQTTIFSDTLSSVQAKLALINPPNPVNIIVWCHKIQVSLLAHSIPTETWIDSPWLAPSGV